MSRFNIYHIRSEISSGVFSKNKIITARYYVWLMNIKFGCFGDFSVIVDIFRHSFLVKYENNDDKDNENHYEMPLHIQSQSCQSHTCEWCCNKDCEDQHCLLKSYDVSLISSNHCWWLVLRLAPLWNVSFGWKIQNPKRDECWQESSNHYCCRFPGIFVFMIDFVIHTNTDERWLCSLNDLLDVTHGDESCAEAVECRGNCQVESFEEFWNFSSNNQSSVSILNQDKSEHKESNFLVEHLQDRNLWSNL